MSVSRDATKDTFDVEYAIRSSAVEEITQSPAIAKEAAAATASQGVILGVGQRFWNWWC